MTLTELARLAHVSTSTASKAFALSPEVNEQTRNLIFDVARANGCFKKFYRSEYPGLFFAVICPEFESTYYSSFIFEMQKHLSRYNSEVAVAATGFDPGTEQRLIEYYQRYHTADGIIVIDGSSSPMGKSEIPIATIDSHAPFKGDVNISNNIQNAINYMIKNWAECSVKDVGFIGERYTSGRLEHLKEAMMLSKIPVKDEFITVTSARFEQAGYLGARELVSRGKLPRAIMCAYDRIALGAIKAFGEFGIRVPEDVAIFSVDDAPFAQYSTPSLTSISTRVDLACQAVVSSLMAKIKGEPFESEIKIERELRVRDSSKIV